MKMLRYLSLSIAALGLIAGTYEPANAAGAWMCGATTQFSGQAKRITNPNTTTSYTTDGRGCAYITAADTGYFASQGFVYDPRTLIGYQVSANTQIGNLPPNAYIDAIIVQETAGQDRKSVV